MDVVWLCTLGLLLGGWFVLDGANLGLGMTLRHTGASAEERRMTLTALGPFLLGGEVWLVAAAGLLIGIFPALEKDLLYAYYPLVIGFIVAWVLRDAGVWFRSRRPTASWQNGWERVIVVASTAFAFAWGTLLGNVAQGVPYGDTPGLGTLLGPYSLLWGVAVVALFRLHGAIFTALRLPLQRRERAALTARRAVVPALVLLGLGVIATPVLDVDLQQPVPALLVVIAAIAAVGAAGRLLAQRRDAKAYACTAVAAFAPVLAVGVAAGSRLLEGIADTSTLDLLAPMVFAVLPVMLAVQAWMWWTFRHRVSARSAVFF